ncbi:MAG: hypothetical protein NT125_00820 [Candidatus Bipolaricaulota bacterium]|jgi:hypothetical protein|nr:hypothetical protein [Candidatus Bipolaricaulota bacterium]
MRWFCARSPVYGLGRSSQPSTLHAAKAARATNAHASTTLASANETLRTERPFC